MYFFIHRSFWATITKFYIIKVLSFIHQHGQSRFTIMEETGYVDHHLSPPWISLNMAKALNLGLLTIPQEGKIIGRGQPFLMVNNRATYQRQSCIPKHQMGKQALFIPTASDDNHLVPAIIEEHKLYFNLCIISLMFMQDPDNHTTWDICQADQPNMHNVN